MLFAYPKTIKHSVLAHLVCQVILFTDAKCRHRNVELPKNVDQTPFAVTDCVFSSVHHPKLIAYQMRFAREESVLESAVVMINVVTEGFA